MQYRLIQLKNSFIIRMTIIITILLYLICYRYIDRPVAFSLYYHDIPTAMAKINAMLLTRFNFGHLILLAFALSLVGIIRYSIHRDKHRACPWLLIGGSTLITGLISKGLAMLLGRTRPLALVQHNAYGYHWLSDHPYWHSAPSATVAATFALLIALIFWLKQYPKTHGWRWLLLILPIIVATINVMSLQHFVGDVVLGAGIATTTVLILDCLLVKQLKP